MNVTSFRNQIDYCVVKTVRARWPDE